MKKLLFLIVFCSTALIQANPWLAKSFSLNDSIAYEGLGSNGISDIYVMNDSTLLIASGAGLSITFDNGENFYTYYGQADGMSYGGVSAITTLGNHIWIATAFDSVGVEEVSGTGGGISHSADGGKTWTHYPQMMDHPDSNFVIVFGDTIDALPVVVPIDNITYDLAATVNSSGDTVLWATSFAGGTRRSKDFGSTWKRVILPPDDQDILDAASNKDFDYSPVDRSDLGLSGNFNHEGFSVAASGDTVAIGTAAGINISYDDGKTWRKYNASNSGITGNFVVALHRDADGNFYGGVLPALGAGEYQSVVFSITDSVNVLYWHSTLPNVRSYNISTGDGRIMVSSSSGGYVSSDGWSWIRLSAPFDAVSGDMLYSDEVYSMAYNGSTLWMGTGDGLASSEDWGLTWKLYRRVNGFLPDAQVRASAYPNPFSPSRMNVLDGDGYVRIHCQFPSAGTVTIGIYDFAMQRVRQIASNTAVTAGEQAFVWNGRNGMNHLVANGTYFIRVSFSGDSDMSAWTKLIILD